MKRIPCLEKKLPKKEANREIGTKDAINKFKTNYQIAGWKM